MKLLDKLFINGIVLALLTLLFFFLTKVLIAGMFIAYLVWIVLRTAYIYLSGRYRLTKSISTKEMENIFALWGVVHQAQYFSDLLPDYYFPRTEGNKIICTQNDRQKIIVCNYKFAPTSCEDISLLYREHENATYSKDAEFFFFGKTPPKEVTLLAETLPFSVQFVSSKEVRKKLILHNALPKPLTVHKTKKPSWRTVFSHSFEPERAKYYFFSSVTFLFYGLLNIFRVWYYSFAGLTFSLGILCLVSLFLQHKKGKNK